MPSAWAKTRVLALWEELRVNTWRSEEVEAMANLVDAARREALEQAARVCDGRRTMSGFEMARAIRALAAKEPT